MRALPLKLAPVKLAPAILLVAVACHDSTSPDRNRLTVSIVAGADATDTVTAKLQQALVVEVRGRNGLPVSGVVVRFSPSIIANSYSPSVLVAPLTSNFYNGFAADSTDSRGIAAVVVQLGTQVGPAEIVIDVPELGVRDTARYTVLPGAAATLTIPVRDTAIAPGAQYSLSALAADRFGNKRPNDKPTYTSRSPVATVDAGGKVTAVQEGRGTVLVQIGSVTDSAQLSVVPLRELAIWGAGKLVTENTDGSQFTLLTSSFNTSLYPQWSPDGTKVLIYEGDPGSDAVISTVDMSGSRDIIVGPDDSLWAASYGRFTRDGNWIYFSGIGKNELGFVTYRVKLDGTQLERVGPGYADGGSLRPDISPDGSTEIFQSSAGVIGSMDIATHTVKLFGVVGSFPRYSPDGTQIAYLAAGQNGYEQLFVMKADGTSQREVSFANIPYWDLAGVDWSPDGQWLLSSTYTGLELVRVADGLRLPLRVSESQAAFKP